MRSNYRTYIDIYMHLRVEQEPMKDQVNGQQDIFAREVWQ